ncbi:Pc16g03440 [Penicillium rubens Wisconsin 54-1255]|uniref:Pc16g03440 protein n=1 Tax=Penicillium rubens (strain ATCC 28089 / DSM 1075 / NRRL 1951 / Wisconsin 54-1255) TaxID=500485 RepID=B6H944_PENRW|nr:Pc16g03440 [Penicillium rubens Wisconsin 54-1255]
MASDQRFQRTVQAVAEAVQTFAVGTFDFAESIKKIWGPQTQPDAVETSDPLPVEGMQDVQTVDQLRDRTPVSQDSDHLSTHSHSYPLSEAMDDGESYVMHERIAPSEQIPCQMIPADGIGKILHYKMEAGIYLTMQNGFGQIERQRFVDVFREAAELLGISLPSPIADLPQQQVGSKRVYQGSDDQQPVAKRQRTQDLLQEDVQGAPEDGEFSSSEEEEVAQIKVQLNRQERSPVKIPDQVPVVHKMTQEYVIHPEEENTGSSSFTQKESSEHSSSEEDGDDYFSEEEEEGVQNPTKEVSQAEHNAKAKTAIRPQDEHSELSSCSSEDESSEDDSSERESDDEAEPRQQQTTKEDSPKGPTYNSKEPIQSPDDKSSDSSAEDESSDELSEAELEEQIEKHLATPEAFFQMEPILLEDSDAFESSASSSEDESSSEESDDEQEEPKQQPTTKEQPPNKGGTHNSKEPIQLTNDKSSNSSSEDESSEEESGDEPEGPKKQPAVKSEPQRREERPEEPIEVAGGESPSPSSSSSSSSEDESSEDSEIET